jgi:type IV pilus assembly protein PilX
MTGSVSRLRPRQQGLALVCALMLMLAAMIVGVSVARAAFGSTASARQERERMVARAAAEAALRDAERDIAGGAQPASERAAWFAAPGSGGFADGCGQGSQDRGLCLPAVAPAPAIWARVDLADEASAVLVPYGRYTGAELAVGGPMLPARLPGYLIERLAPGGAGPQHGSFYRITAIGFGTRASTRVVLQALYRRPPPAAPAAAEGAAAPEPQAEAQPGPQAQPQPSAQLPAGRIGWRDVANWPELHARALQ